MYDSGLGRTIDSIDHVPRDSATGLALKGVTPPSSGFFESGGTASFWFSQRKYGGGDPILIEQAISLGQFGALTLLYPDDYK